MEMTQLKASLNQTLAEHDAPNVRYRGLAISTHVVEALSLITQTLQILLPRYTLWELGQNEAPALPIHRADFIEKAFEMPQTGLIISLPENWMFEWSNLDQRAFWAALSETYGRHTIIAVFADTFENTSQVEPYFNVKSLSSLPLRVWISKYQF